ncbi:hypothetical protein HPB52_007404 [Rhipicephalus sanguineus]|uniref:THAP-type domain-containing protein n=1 Tax=Rhipicephalus sanguineus TaxID=34632 RepID=A0A9D4QI48_RHISA|nr:hypothetical protein HPB52_007404 [Rhipicephalus sanguineus]
MSHTGTGRWALARILSGYPWLLGKRFQVLETVDVMEDLRSQRPFGPLSGLNAYLVAGVLRINDVDDGVSRLYKRPKASAKGSGSVNPTVSFHVVPRDEPRRSQWLNAVPIIRRQKKESEKPMLSSLHFSPSGYVCNPALGKALGVPKSGVLSRSAVPSTHFRHRCPCRSKPASR